MLAKALANVRIFFNSQVQLHFPETAVDHAADDGAEIRLPSAERLKP